ncbi:uncharacterized protein N7443_004843 [Penicillium atrosanguineum]|nr:uncharacterized protein N7443_004843 [Penicillium atrosanguineum]KAJ5305183.1 hypothetical protein N7443_004843 [Penicillium atrosanguineum]
MAENTTPTVRLWYSPGACSFVPHVALGEAGIKADLILAQVGAMAEEFQAVNPKRRVPVLAIDDEVITEMAAILTAVSSLAPESKLLGRTTLETIRVYEWLNYFSTTAHAQAVASVFRTERFTNDPSTYPAIRQKGRETIQEVYALIEEKLKASGTQFAVGDSFTVADACLVLLYLWASRLNIEME